MKKQTILTGVLFTTIALSFAQDNGERKPVATGTRPMIMKAKIEDNKGQMMRAMPNAGMGTSTMGMKDDDMPPMTGDAATDKKIQALHKEMMDKIKAIREEYQKKIKAVIGDKKVLTKESVRMMQASSTMKGDDHMRMMKGSSTMMMGSSTEGRRPFPRNSAVRGESTEANEVGTTEAQGQGGFRSFFNRFFGH